MPTRQHARSLPLGASVLVPTLSAATDAQRTAGPKVVGSLLNAPAASAAPSSRGQILTAQDHDEQDSAMRERLRSVTLWVLVAGVAVGVGLIAVGVLAGEDFDLWGEIGKAGIELGLIVVGGTVLTTIITTRQGKLADQRQQSEAFRSWLLDELMTAYRGLKEVRRSLRAAGLQAPSGKLTADQVGAFGTQMELLNTLQLSLEDCVRLIQARPILLNDAQRLVPKLNNLETYVGEMVTEWEQNGQSVTTDAEASTVSTLDAIQRFLGPARSRGGFKENASQPVRDLIGEILALRRTPPKKRGAAPPADGRRRE